MMKRKLIALAIAGAFAAPAVALAQASNVTIYGTANVDFENVKASGGAVAGVPSRNRVSQNSSNIGFKGVEDLGGGLKAIFQIESNVGFDGAGLTPSATAGGGTFASRNTNVGLSGNWGTVFYGNWDTPFKAVTNRTDIDPFGNTGIGGYSGVFANGTVNAANAGTTGNTAAASASFDRRQNNSVQYWTPTLNGFSGRVAYGANEEKVAGGANPSLWSLSATYESGPLYVTGAYERHNDYGASALGAVGRDDKGWKIGAGYTFGNTRIAAIYQRLNYETGTAALPTETKLRNLYFSVAHKVGNGQIRAAFTRARDPKGTGAAVGGAGAGGSDGGAKQFSVGYGHNLSKRTEIYALYTKISNDTTATYNFATNALAGVAAGQDPRGFGLGIKHTF